MGDAISPIKRTSLFGTTFWVVVGGLLLLNISFFIEFFDPLLLQQSLFRLDFRYWFPGLAYPLWLVFVLLTIDAVTFRQLRTETGKWKGRFEITVLAIKVGLVICITYLFLDLIHAPFHRPWRLLWYACNVPLFAFS